MYRLTRIVPLSAVLLAIFTPLKAELPTTTTVTAIRLDPDDLHRSRVGELIWRGGVDIQHSDPRFGGLSGLHIGQDGKRLIAVSDRGYRVTARLGYAKGALTDVTDIHVARLRRSNGAPTKGGWHDAESLSPDGNGGFLVSFERRHRIVNYPTRNGTPLANRPSRLTLPQDAATQPFNGGIEALTRLCDGRFIAISEKAKFEGNENTRGMWIGRGDTWRSTAYPAFQAFSPTGAATLPDCSVLVVERSFNIMEGVRARIVRLSATAFDPKNKVTTQELAYLAPPLSVDNMQGIAVREGDAGETLVYLVSDNNFSGYQRTLLMMFELAPSATPSVKSRSTPKFSD
jgi:hypothetical protein